MICIPGIISRLRDILTDQIDLITLAVNHVRHIAEELVELANRLLDVSDLRLAFDDELFLEIDVILVGKAELFLLLLLLLELGPLFAWRRRVLQGGTCSRVRRLLFLDGLTLELLELSEGGLEFAAQLGLGEALGGLFELAQEVHSKVHSIPRHPAML